MGCICRKSETSNSTLEVGDNVRNTQPPVDNISKPVQNEGKEIDPELAKSGIPISESDV